MMQRYYIIDFLRGFAAVLVLISHYGHFFQYQQKGYPDQYSNQMLPLYDHLSFIYHHGGKAVELFFCISGFVFFMYYFKKISMRSISPWNFFVLRFSRLYPLHLVTLVFVAIFAFIFFQKTGFHFVYDQNNLKHFILNLFLISHWGFQDGTSFNEPIWSVSIEIFLYGAFFILSYFLRNILMICISSILVGLLITFNIYYSFGVGIVCFFMGGLVFYAHEQAIKYQIETAAITLTTLMLLFVAFIIFHNPFYLEKNEIDIAAFFILFPILVLLISFLDRFNLLIFKKIRLLGDLSYSIYIIHFPIQLIIVTLCVVFNFDVDFSQPVSLLTFLTLTLIFSYLSYNYLELPVREYFRKFIN